MNIIETTIIPLDKIDGNRGQIPGVPANPRILDADDYDRLSKSIESNPEMLNLRELIVYEYKGRYVVIGGNMRLHTMMLLGHKEAPCKIIPSDTTPEQLKAITIKDNVNYGDWDEGELRKSWKDEPLDDWGIHLEEVFQEEQKEEEKEDATTLNLKFSPDEFRFIKQKLNEIDKDNAKAIIQIIKAYGD